MKRVLTLFLFSFLLTASQAQLTDGTMAPQLTLTDIYGNEHVLYDYLAEGKTVLIDIFATWCGPCWFLHQNHALQNLWDAYGPDGTNEMVILSIEGDASTSHADLLGTGNNTQGNWVDGVTYPVIENTQVPGLFSLSYWPTIYLIRPSGAVFLANDYLFANVLAPERDWIYEIVTRGENDVQISTTQTDRVNCGNVLFTGSARVKNMGTANLTSATVHMLLNGEIAQTREWTGNLTEFRTANVFFSPVTLSETTEITYVALSPNGTDDGFPDDNFRSVNYNFPVATTSVEFSITTDFWPEEISWRLLDAAGTQLYSNADVGPLECDQTYTQTFELSTDGCHRLVLADSYGDGLLNGPINPGSHNCMTPNGLASIAMGAVSLVSDGVVLFDNISYGSGIQVPFKYSETSSTVQPIDKLESVQVFPNPARELVNLEFTLTQPSDLIIEILDVTGKSMMRRAAMTYPAGTHIEHIDVARFANGTYFVRMTERNKVNTLKFTVIN